MASVARHQEHKSECLCPPRLGIRVATETSTVKRRTRRAFCTQGRDEDRRASAGGAGPRSHRRTCAHLSCGKRTLSSPHRGQTQPWDGHTCVSRTKEHALSVQWKAIPVRGGRPGAGREDALPGAGSAAGSRLIFPWLRGDQSTAFPDGLLPGPGLIRRGGLGSRRADIPRKVSSPSVRSLSKFPDPGVTL